VIAAATVMVAFLSIDLQTTKHVYNEEGGSSLDASGQNVTAVRNFLVLEKAT
jgi:hypothetical protein